MWCLQWEQDESPYLTTQTDELNKITFRDNIPEHGTSGINDRRIPNWELTQ
jgi:hypothetical protein